WRWVKIKFAVGLATTTVLLIFAVATANGLFSRNTTSQFVTADRPAQPQLTPIEQATAVPRPDTAQAQLVRKTGALTGFVLYDQGHPVSGAKVWGGFSSQPYAEDTTDDAGQFALSKIAAPAYVTVMADGYAADQQSFDLTNATDSLVFHLVPTLPLAI